MDEDGGGPKSSRAGGWFGGAGMTRAEQRALIFLILVFAVGLGYEYQRGGPQGESLVLHRAPGNVVEPQKQATSGATAGADGWQIDINHATAEDLEMLPGIGPVRAKGILQYRQAHGPFARIEDLTLVPGIGEKTLEAVRPYLKPLETPATTPTAAAATPNVPMPQPLVASLPAATGKININTASEAELRSLDGIGEVLARRIVEYRQKNGPFRAIDDIEKVPGIGPVIFARNRDRITVGAAQIRGQERGSQNRPK